MSTAPVLQAADVIGLHDRLLADPLWPRDEPAVDDVLSATPGRPKALTTPSGGSERSERGGLWYWVQTNHRNNCLLWAEEDLARRTTVADGDIAANKRAIDGFNQARNDATERVDELLLIALGLVDAASARTDSPKTTVGASARLNSETAGSMIDRMSILALKIDAMRRQTERGDVDAAHVASSKARLARLEEQRADLAACLDSLLVDALAGRAYFKVYRQFKMYNDPRFNPALVAEAKAARAY